MSTSRLRRAGPADAALLARLGRETFAETFAEANTPANLAAFLDETYGETQQARELADPDGACFLAESEDGVVGFVQLRAKTPPVEVPERSEDRIDVTVVGDVVAEVGHGGPVEGRQPHRLDAERSRRSVVQMIQMLDESGQIADPVAAGIRERPRIDLIDRSSLPPVHRATVASGPDRALARREILRGRCRR